MGLAKTSTLGNEGGRNRLTGSYGKLRSPLQRSGSFGLNCLLLSCFRSCHLGFQLGLDFKIDTCVNAG